MENRDDLLKDCRWSVIIRAYWNRLLSFPPSLVKYVFLDLDTRNFSLSYSDAFPDSLKIAYRDVSVISNQSQIIFSRRSFELTPLQKTVAEIFNRCVDFSKTYVSNTVQRKGFVEESFEGRSDAYPTKVRWESGEEDAIDSVANIPAAFISYQKGDYFEATVEIDRKTGCLKKILTVRPIPPFDKDDNR